VRILQNFSHLPFSLRSFLLFTGVLFSLRTEAQLCNGSPGDPVLHHDFSGNETDYPSPPGYGFTSHACPGEGYYTLTTATSNCFGNAWHNVPGDHTGNGGFMLINLLPDPADFFVTIITGLCPNTTYTYSSWILNLMKLGDGVKPDITITIETPFGIILQQLNTLDIPVTDLPAWTEYGFSFTNPPGNTSVVLRMTSNARGGYGNDIAMDDIMLRPCGPLINAEIAGHAKDTVDACEGGTTTYTMNGTLASGYIAPVYQWQLSTDGGEIWEDIPGANAASYQSLPLQPGVYEYRLTVAEADVAGIKSCRLISKELTITVHTKPLVNAGPDRTVFTGSPVTLLGETDEKAFTYSWSPDLYIDDIHKLNPVVTPPFDMIYTLTAVTAFGCANADEMNVKVVRTLFVPNAFTPNGDGKNDRWEIPFLDPSSHASVRVYNRWGQLVYRAENEFVSWDGNLNGKVQTSGVYVYVISFRENPLILKGTLVLIK